ncbi:MULTISPECIES: pentapeptide repeat-containing protein [unclassified Microbacterium]|uniref:pentapeptide repeat-containing protein n=1 Tax=unclassified Microbacterium TaxID=2609290 RepID=UPI000EA8A320|nr:MULTISPECIES: pentapeptide repeat-containing protein [unclassified Microbacterium]MBT2486250.1 pentapeptide repeat-containing protein [Microbacterium sp. ISL-108]RKN68967.1 pentapeptide repeat-containing protein [Microbacterium sp. CGR2]
MARSSESPVAPRVSLPDLPEEFVPATPARRADLLAAALDLTGTADLAYASLEQCTVHADTDSVDLTGATVLDVAMTGVRTTALRLRDSGIRRLSIRGGRIGTLDLSGARIDELELLDLKIDYLNLGGARATDVDISGCSIRSIDMPQSELRRVRFSNCSSDEVDPRGMRATDVDLRGLDALSYLDVNSLRGTTLSGLQVQHLAAVMAAGLGIQIRD